MADYACYMQRADIPTETRCHTICGENSLEATKRFIRGRIAQENRKFGKGFNPWRLVIEKIERDSENSPERTS